MPDSIPKMLPGRVHARRVKCGKPSCRCARGALHVAHVRLWTEGGRQRKAHVRRADVEATRAACRAWEEAEAAVSALLNSPEADDVRARTRAALCSALGEQIDTPGGRRELRRLRSRAPGRKPDRTLERLAGALSGLELKMFRF